MTQNDTLAANVPSQQRSTTPTTALTTPAIFSNAPTTPALDLTPNDTATRVISIPAMPREGPLADATNLDQVAPVEISHKNIMIERGGDTVIEVQEGDKVYSFLVAGAKVEIAAPSLFQHICSQLQEGSLQSIPSLELDCQDHTALRIILDICHHRFDELPESISFTTLFELAKLCNEYEVQNLLMRFARPWLTSFIEQALESEDLRWVMISWAFGLESIFRGYMVYLTFALNTDEEIGKSSALDESASELLEGLPNQCRQILSGFIATIRNNCLRAMQTLVAQYLDHTNFSFLVQCEHHYYVERNKCIHARYGAFAAQVSKRYSILPEKSCKVYCLDEEIETLLRLNTRRFLRKQALSASFKFELGEDESGLEEEDDEFDEHENCDLHEFKDVLGRLVATFQHDFCLPPSVETYFSDQAVRFSANTGNQIWGSLLGVGANASSGFAIKDLPIHSSLIKTFEPPKRSFHRMFPDDDGGMADKLRRSKRLKQSHTPTAELSVTEDENSEPKDDDDDLDEDFEPWSELEDNEADLEDAGVDAVGHDMKEEEFSDSASRL